MLRTLASLLVPPLCGICAAPCDPADAVCRNCQHRLAMLRPSASLLGGELELISAAPYEGVARELVTRLKFSGRLALAGVAAERMVRARGAMRSQPLVPVPPSPARQRLRGFDVAGALAAAVAEASPVSVVNASLERDDGPAQVGRPRAARLASPPRVRLARGIDAAPADDVWLIDDVATTGATLLASAAALYDAGATRVRALTFARAKPDRARVIQP